MSPMITSSQYPERYEPLSPVPQAAGSARQATFFRKPRHVRALNLEESRENWAQTPHARLRLVLGNTATTSKATWISSRRY